jgi:hypothetical protein
MVVIGERCSVILEGLGGGLEIVVGEADRCNCWFLGDQRTLLGSESATHLFSRLQECVIGDKGEYAGEIAGVAVRTVIGFGGVFSRLFVCNLDQQRVLFCRDKDGEVVGHLRLGPKELAAWGVALEPKVRTLPAF